VRAVYGLPAAVPPLRDPFADASADWLVDTPGPVPWATVLALNAHGLEAISRAVYLHPTRASRRVPVQLGTPADSNNLVVALTLVGGMALLEVVLLAGPAFAVGAKRRRRELAVLGAVGGSPADLRRSVLAGGVVLGTLAGLAGTIGAIAVAAAGEPLMEHLISRRPGAFTVPVAQLVALFGVAVLAAVAAAALPARAAARTDLVASLGGRRGTTRTRRRLTALGLAVAAAGAAVSLTATVSSSSALVILGGAALLEVGLIMCTPALLGFVARGGRRLPLQARLALRDTGRNRSAATPAVAAVMAAAIGAVSIAIALASVDDQDRRQYVPALPPNTARVTLPAGTSDATSASVARALARTLPSAAVAVLHAPRTACPGPADSCTVTTLVHLDDAQRTGLLADILVAGPDDAAALFGPGSTAERDALRHGMALVSDPTLARGGQVPLALTPMTVTADGLGTDGSGTGQQVAFTLPAQAMHGDAAPATIVVPAAALSGRGADLAPVAVLVRTRQLPTDAQLQAATARVRRVVAGGVVEVERGYHNRYAAGTFAVVGGAVAIAVLAAVIATGLANVDAAPDLRTLGAVGATPRTRRTLASARAGVIAALGAVLGGGAGFVVPAAWELNQHRADPSSSLRFVVPWPTVLAVAVGIPVLAAAISGATTRSRLPIETSAA
ncbi:MAG: FtsX-like permease family protein, partial [Jatrophihabitans sp.]|uniref:FtsX-like permease family protein n=1 Tax=Jatrophihabitans sp. TaxID=1932789 RepID=UPI003F80FCE9